MTINECGSCTACCRVFAIPETSKPAGKWCDKCNIGKGCTIYETRPARCVDYECIWLQAKLRGDAQHKLPDSLRPDRCKVVFSPTTNPRIIAAMVMPGMTANALQRDDVASLIHTLTANDFAVAVGEPNSLNHTLIDKFGSKQVEMTEPDADGMQWSKNQ
jgi:hypothetical protein